ncbi:MAG: ceramidase domain-containing protein [Alphaproteobacteria bacterium]
MNNFIDIYCERLGPGFWAEPFNAATNIAFFIAAFFAFQLAKKSGSLNWANLLLVGLLAAIGAGSFLFHTLATEWAQLADVIPILLYQLAFLGLYSRHVMNSSQKSVQSLFFIFLLMIAAVHQVPDDVLNGSVAYLPALFFLVRFALWHFRSAAHEKWLLPAAAGLFVLSLTFRSLDMQFCPQMPLGLHFLWHMLNGLLLYLTARAYMLNTRRL